MYKLLVNDVNEKHDSLIYRINHTHYLISAYWDAKHENYYLSTTLPIDRLFHMFAIT